MLISDTKNMLILNSTVTFKYEYYLFLQQTARHTTPKKYFRILKKVFEKLNLIHALRKLPGKKCPKIKLQRLPKIRIWTFVSLVHQINSI